MLSRRERRVLTCLEMERPSCCTDALPHREGYPGGISRGAGKQRSLIQRNDSPSYPLLLLPPPITSICSLISYQSIFQTVPGSSCFLVHVCQTPIFPPLAPDPERISGIHTIWIGTEMGSLAIALL